MSKHRAYVAIHQRVVESCVPLANTVLAHFLFQKRSREHLSVREAAKAIGIDGSTYYRMETKDVVPDTKILFKVADWLGLTTIVELKALCEPSA